MFVCFPLESCDFCEGFGWKTVLNFGVFLDHPNLNIDELGVSEHNSNLKLSYFVRNCNFCVEGFQFRVCGAFKFESKRPR